MSGGYELVSLGSEHAKHLSSIVLNNIRLLHVILSPNFFYQFNHYLNTICFKIIPIWNFLSNFSREIHKAVNIINCINKLICTCKSSIIACLQKSLNQIRCLLIELHTINPGLLETFGGIKHLIDDSSKALVCDMDIHTLNEKLCEMIKRFKFSLSEITKIESCIRCAKSKIIQITKLKQELCKQIEKILLLICISNQPSKLSIVIINGNALKKKIKCLSEKIDRFSSEFTTVENNTSSLKSSINKFINLCVSYVSLQQFRYTQLIFYKDIDEVCSLFNWLYCWICKISNFTCDCKCTCTCSSKTPCNENTICLCICKCTGAPSSNGCCICICKKQEGSSNCKCLCICICNKNGDSCGCESGGQHTCEKCLVKVNIRYLLSMTSKILCYLRWIKCYLERYNKKCCYCDCCHLTPCNTSCCVMCENNMYYYKSTISTMNCIGLLFKEVGANIQQLRTLKNILSRLLIIATNCKPCPQACCKDKINDLIDIISASSSYYNKIGSGIGDLRSFVEYKLFYPKSEQIIHTLEKSIKCLLNNTRIMDDNTPINGSSNRSTVMSFEPTNKLNSINKIATKNIFIIISKIAIVEYNVVFYELSKHVYNSWDILGILSAGIRRCCCICCFQYDLKCGKIKFIEYPEEDHTRINNHLQYYVMSMADNQGNNLCLCLVTKYLLFGNVRTLMCYMGDMVRNLYSSLTRNFDKYTHSTTYMFSVGKLIMMIISVIYKITIWMKFKYLCTCPPGCPCCTGGSGRCTSDCRICKLPATKCCLCPKQPSNCSSNTNGNNNSCSCKCSQKNGRGCSSCCSGSCSSNGCCRCCCNCFCKNYEDPYYPYLISIILFVSSILENIWTMDPETLRMSIESLSSLLSEYQSLHVYTNYGTGRSTSNVSGRTDLSNLKLLSTSLTQYINMISLTTTRKNGTCNGKGNGCSSILLHSQMKRSQAILVDKSVKSFFKSVISSFSLLIATPLFALVYSNLSGLAFYMIDKSSTIGLSSVFLRRGLMTLSHKYLECTPKKVCTCQVKNGVCKICPILKIRINCLSISFKDMGLIIGNVSGDMLLNYLMGSISITEDFITNLCVGFGEVYTIMLKNIQLTSSSYPGSNNDNYGTSVKNWGYDSLYERQVTTITINYLLINHSKSWSHLYNTKYRYTLSLWSPPIANCLTAWKSQKP